MRGIALIGLLLAAILAQCQAGPLMRKELYPAPTGLDLSWQPQARAAPTEAITPEPISQHNITVSGQSAGASQAIQHLFAFSASVEGAAILAGSPYGCGNLPLKRMDECYGYAPYGYGDPDGMESQKQMVAYVRQHYKAGRIDDPANLWETPVLLFSGANDYEVYTKVMRSVKTQLSAFVSPKKIKAVFDTKAGHVWSVDHGHCGCGVCHYGYGDNYGYGYGADAVHGKQHGKHCCDVNNCEYDLSGDMLKMFYGPLKPRVKAQPRLHWVQQEPYVPRPANATTAEKDAAVKHSLVARWAILYVPEACKGRVHACRVHVNYHGCQANRWQDRLIWVKNININEYAEANDIIVVYPQEKGDKMTGKGCWNWISKKDDRNFDTKQSKQLRMVMNMVANLTEAVAHARVMHASKYPMIPGMVEDF